MITVFEDRQPTLAEAQEIVGGLVEMVRSPTKPDWQILVNEEGFCLSSIVARMQMMDDDFGHTDMELELTYANGDTKDVTSLVHRLIRDDNL